MEVVMRLTSTLLAWLFVLCVGCDVQEKIPTLLSTTDPGLAKEINIYRIERQRYTLQFDSSLQKAAQRQADDMAKHDHLDHKGSDGSSFFQRAEDAGFPMTAGGEIIASVDGDNKRVIGNKEAVEMWKKSAGHNEIMLSKKYIYFGTAVSGRYACAVFGNK
jgi:uncharacterized protein YkwD